MLYGVRRGENKDNGCAGRTLLNDAVSVYGRPGSARSSTSEASYELLSTISQLRYFRASARPSFSAPLPRLRRQSHYEPDPSHSPLRRFLFSRPTRSVPELRLSSQLTESPTRERFNIPSRQLPPMPYRRDRQRDSDSPHKSRDVAAYLKYLVRGFLKQFRADTWLSDKRKSSAYDECFVPSPKVTFLLDEPILTCQICRRTPMKMAITADFPAPEMPAILPCGHVTCYGCISTWLTTSHSCPFCRTDMVYPGCRHRVQPRIVAQDTIHILPKTLTKGGKIGEECFECAEKTCRETSLKAWADLAEKFISARCQAEMQGTDEAVKEMREAQEAFEQLPEDDYWTLARIKHQQW